LRAGHTAENYVDGNLLFEGMRTQSMGARQIDKLDSLVVDFERADMTFNRNAGVVANPLPETGQSIKQCALAGIWITDHRDAGIRLPAPGDVVKRNASFGRFSHRCWCASR